MRAVDLAIGYFPDLKQSSFFQQKLFTHHFVCLLRTDRPVQVEYGTPAQGLKVIQPPFQTLPIELKQHWHRKVHNDARNLWLRKLVSGLFNEDTDEW